MSGYFPRVWRTPVSVSPLARISAKPDPRRTYKIGLVWQRSGTGWHGWHGIGLNMGPKVSKPLQRR